jgi:hypothetical protein
VEPIDAIRHELAVLAARKESRIVGWSQGLPCDWKPEQVRNPATGLYFTPNGAWQYVADLLRGGEPLEEMTLEQPAGKRGYVMRVKLGSGMPELYIKLQLGGGKVIGRSFHYSYQSNSSAGAQNTLRARPAPPAASM